MDLFAGLGGGGGINPLAALERLANATGGDPTAAMRQLMGGGPMSRMIPNMDEMNEAMEELVELDTRAKYVFGPGVNDIMLDETRKWCIVYPHYIDAQRTVKQGRRLKKELAIQNPTAQGVAQACSTLQLRWVLEDKCYPRDFLLRGRVRVELFQDPSNKAIPVNHAIPNKFVLLKRIAEVFPKDGPHRK
eukprot:Gregarina_sp_Poly_1__5@NODE_1001_length_5410_cov_144_854950_g702_i0_p3_GENE_NODE_1001_length_5410_cov_144_854950_g702_i0NODE_1001_length_5410_cov_144_854950_g702_i0_p3_ORF_typecomplete_len190_score27_24SRP19/PF01922_17/4_6e26_NODE_1001_length_5410_cov_144_854950_g702_i032773846